MKVGVVTFPGSNSDHDAYHVVKHVMGLEARFVWHKENCSANMSRQFRVRRSPVFKMP